MPNPQITAQAAAVALQGSFPGDLGIEVIEVEDDSVAGRLVVDRRHLHPGGYVHGGIDSGRGGSRGGIGSSPTGNADVTLYAQVDDVRKYLERAESAGGSVLMPATEVGGGTTFGIFREPGGSSFGVYTM